MAIAHVQSTPAGVITASQSVAVTFPGNVTAGNMITVAISMYRVVGSPPTVTSITDTQGNTYAADVELAMTFDGAAYVGIWSAFNITGGANVVTVNVAGTNNDITAVASEFSGTLTTDPIDGADSAQGNSQSPSMTITTVDSAPGVVGAFTFLGTTRSMTAGSGYATLGENEAATTSMALHAEFQAFASSGVKTVDGAIGTGTVQWAIVAASYKAAGGAPRRFLLVHP